MKHGNLIKVKVMGALLLSLFFLSHAASSLSQDIERLKPLVSYMNPVPIEGIGSLFWSNNSQKLIFADTILLPSHEWYQYDVVDKTFTTTDKNPLTLAPTKTNCLESASFIQAGNDGVVFTAPDDRYTTYLTAQPLYNNMSPLAVFDCSTGHSIELPRSMPGIGRILWSNSSNAFVLVDEGVVSRNYYVTGFAVNISKTQLRRLELLKQNTNILGVNNVFDISDDGNRLLMRVGLSEPVTNVTNYKLYIYNALYPSNDQIIADFDATNVIAASFAPYDENKLWIFNESGIVQYDLVTQKTLLLDDRITSIDALNVVSIGTQAIFSPDGRYLATLGKEGLYLIDLSQSAEQVSLHASVGVSTPQPEALLRLTLTVDCPDSYQNTLTWTVHNPNNIPVTTSWQQRVFEAAGTITVPAETSDVPGTVNFQTNSAPFGNSNAIDLFANDFYHDTSECFQWKNKS